MNTDEMLIGKTARTMTLHAGPHRKVVPAGTEVMVSTEAWENTNAAVYVRVAGHPRIAGVVYKSSVVPA